MAARIAPMVSICASSKLLTLVHVSHTDCSRLIAHNKEHKGLDVLRKLHVRPGDTNDIAAKEEYYQIRELSPNLRCGESTDEHVSG